MIKLYIDFDGVILNTIDVTYQLLGEIDLKDHDKVLEFYQNLDWEDLIKKSTPIENSINNLKKLLKSNLYDISILSHVASAEEAKAKKKYLKANIPEINLIAVNIMLNKCDVVDCKNSILVDDYMGNLELWYEKGGIPVKFSDKGKKYHYITITSLEDLIEKYDEINYLLKINM